MKAERTKFSLRPGAAVCLTMALALVSFWLLDTQAVSAGDDLGYMFADTTLHAGDGHQVASLSDITNTQTSHWRTCNGRVIIHSLVMFFLSIAGAGWFHVANALVFALLVGGLCVLVLPQKARKPGPCLGLLLLVWLCLPRPGVVMLSLVAYAVNYLWTGAAITGVLLLWRRLREGRMSKNAFYLAAIAALIAGALQESFSLPLSAGLLIWWLIRGHKATAREIAFILCFLIGTALVTFAPGNFNRPEAGGGLSPEAILLKSRALAHDLLFSSINLLAIISVVMAATARQRAARFFNSNAILLTAILASLILASLTYTAERQLFAPSLFAAILLGQIIFSEPMVKALSSPLAFFGLLLIYGGTIFGAYEIRRPAPQSIAVVREQASEGKRIIEFDIPEPEQGRLFRFLFDRFSDNPLEGREIKLLFDSYSKNGFSRLYSPAHTSGQISTFLPRPATEIAAKARSARFTGDTVTPAPVTPYYSAFPVKALTGGKSPFKVKRADGKRLGYERFLRNDTLYYIVAAEAAPIILKPRKP